MRKVDTLLGNDTSAHKYQYEQLSLEEKRFVDIAYEARTYTQIHLTHAR